MSFLISCKNLTKKCGDFELKDISFDLEPGYILGVIGRNGVGKTTLLRSLLGSYRIDTEGNGGQVSILGYNSTEDIIKYKNQIGFILQDNPFSLVMTALEIAEIYGRYYEAFDMKLYKDLLDEYQVSYKKEKTAKNGRTGKVQKSMSDLSTGEQIRVQLAFARACHPKLYIFDEATGNLDVEFREKLYKDIRELTATGECSVIYATHLVEEMEEFADYVLWIRKKENEGYVHYYGTLDELKDEYRIVESEMDVINSIPKEFVVGVKSGENHKEALVRVGYSEFSESVNNSMRYPDIKEIMYYVEKVKVNRDERVLL
ncbi:MAG: ABC transporter ATP-binding protein [Lachnospiraceae bacterium]|nr:ABC transporter ATP-binding protein [Lachnospiraceae bacterium]